MSYNSVDFVNRMEKQKKELTKITCDNTSLMEQIVSMGQHLKDALRHEWGWYYAVGFYLHMPNSIHEDALTLPSYKWLDRLRARTSTPVWLRAPGLREHSVCKSVQLRLLANAAGCSAECQNSQCRGPFKVCGMAWVSLCWQSRNSFEFRRTIPNT